MGRLALAFLGCLVVAQIAVEVVRRASTAASIGRASAAARTWLRLRLLDPTTVARRVGLRPGMQVLHVGADDPAVTAALQNIVGPAGRVRSVTFDVPIPDRLPFDDQSFDAICLVSAFGSLANGRRAWTELWRVLRPAGRLSASDVAVHSSFRLRRTVEEWAEALDFECLEHFGNLLAYTTNLRKPLAVAAN
jgi:SAM-dependent methyltransferase